MGVGNGNVGVAMQKWPSLQLRSKKVINNKTTNNYCYLAKHGCFVASYYCYRLHMSEQQPMMAEQRAEQCCSLTNFRLLSTSYFHPWVSKLSAGAILIQLQDFFTLQSLACMGVSVSAMNGVRIRNKHSPSQHERKFQLKPLYSRRHGTGQQIRMCCCTTVYHLSDQCKHF